jgi:hypothetical protein
MLFEKMGELSNVMKMFPNNFYKFFLYKSKNNQQPIIQYTALMTRF